MTDDRRSFWILLEIGAVVLLLALACAGAFDVVQTRMAWGATEEPPPRKSADAPAASKRAPAAAGAIRGRVIDDVDGKPAKGVVVTIQATKQSLRGGSDQRRCRNARTDANGEYQFSGLATADYNIWADANDRTCAALNSVPVVTGEVGRVDDLQLVEGSWLEGRVLTLRGQPVSRHPKTGDRLRVGLSGPARPRTGESLDFCEVDDDGRFRVRVPAGRNFPYIFAPEIWQRTWRKEKFERGIDVEAGRVALVNFRVREQAQTPLPSPRPARDPVKLPSPVAAEWDAAETIRDLGGWYQLDADRHVVEINMVYHEDGGTRYDNGYTDSDEALRIAPAFGRLKRLFLHKGQATDESMACLADLEGICEDCVWAGPPSPTREWPGSARHCRT